MKLVKIEEAWHKETLINIDSIALIQKEGKEGTHIFFQNNYDAFFNIPIEKVLQAISGSQEHLRIEGDAAKKVVSNKKNHLR